MLSLQSSNTNQQFDTERLILKKLSQNDACFIYELVNTTDWIKNIGDRNVRSIDDAQSYVQKIIDNPNLSYWVVSLRNTTSSIGIITLIKRDYLEHHDIGFAFLPQHAKQGYAYESAKVVLDEISKSQLHQCILAITLRDNLASIRLLEKLGMIFDEIIKVETDSLLRYTLKMSN